MSNNEWQPIETAPKDGTEILFLIKRPYIVYDGRLEYTQFYIVSKFCDYEERWTNINYGYNKDIRTHWLPIPKPPQN